MKINIRDISGLKRILFRDLLIFFIFTAFFLAIGIFVVIKQNPIIQEGIIQEKVQKENRQIIYFDYMYNKELKHDSIVQKWHDAESKMLVELFSEDEYNKGDKITLAIDRINGKAEETYESTTSDPWYYKLLNAGGFFIIASLIIIPLVLFSILNKHKLLLNSSVTKGVYLKTTSHSTHDSGTTYYHHYNYLVNKENYTIKEKGRYNKFYAEVQVIYQNDKPQNAVVFEHLTKRLKAFLHFENPHLSLNNTATSIQPS